MRHEKTLYIKENETVNKQPDTAIFSSLKQEISEICFRNLNLRRQRLLLLARYYRITYLSVHTSPSLTNRASHGMYFFEQICGY